MRAYFNPNKYEQRNWCHLNPIPQTKIGLIQKLTVISNQGSIPFSLSLAKADPSIAWARLKLSSIYGEIVVVFHLDNFGGRLPFNKE
jgi:hypothetical protein